MYYVYLLKGEVCAPVDRDKFTGRLYEIRHMLTLVRPGYIFDNKMADDRERMAVNIPASACARISTPPPPLPLSLRVVSPSQDEFATSCKRSAEFCKEIRVIRGEGWLGYPRPYKWGLTDWIFFSFVKSNIMTMHYTLFIIGAYILVLIFCFFLWYSVI